MLPDIPKVGVINNSGYHSAGAAFIGFLLEVGRVRYFDVGSFEGRTLDFDPVRRLLLGPYVPTLDPVKHVLR